jgi:hypothetical protein
MAKSEAEKKAKKEREEVERLERLKKANYTDKASNPKCLSCGICGWRVGNYCSNVRISPNPLKMTRISLSGGCRYFKESVITHLPEECKKF